MPLIKGVPRRPVLLVILDGFGVNPSKRNNAVCEAETPRLDAYFSRYPHTTLNASGHAVGLPDGQMGNSEVGHLVLGAGDIIRQDIVRINDAITRGEFFTNPALLDAADLAKRQGCPVHLIGLVSDGGVHSHLDHLSALIRLCRARGARPLLHMITDGRDTPPQSALSYLRDGGKSATLNCGYGHGYSVRDVLAAVARANGAPLNITEEPRRAGDPPELIAVAKKIRAVLGWSPQFDDLDTIVSTSLAWERKIADQDPTAYWAA